MSDSAKKSLLVVAALAAVAVAGVMLMRSDSGSGGNLPQQYSIDGVCLKCHESGQFSYSAKQDQPLVCPKCGERAVYSWFYCNACKKRFVPKLQVRADGVAVIPMVPACPACGSTDATPFIQEDPTQQPAGDTPLPAWPPK